MSRDQFGVDSESCLKDKEASPLLLRLSAHFPSTVVSWTFESTPQPVLGKANGSDMAENLW